MVLTGSTRLWRLASLGYYRQQGTALVLNYAQKFVNILCFTTLLRRAQGNF